MGARKVCLRCQRFPHGVLPKPPHVTVQNDVPLRSKGRDPDPTCPNSSEAGESCAKMPKSVHHLGSRVLCGPKSGIYRLISGVIGYLNPFRCHRSNKSPGQLDTKQITAVVTAFHPSNRRFTGKFTVIRTESSDCRMGQPMCLRFPVPFASSCGSR